MDPDRAILAIQQKLADPACACRGFVAELQHHFDLRVHAKVQHLWSPTLSGSLTPLENGQSLLHGLISPNPSIWTAVAFSYLACFTGLLFFLTFGVVQISLGQQPWAFFAVAAILVLAASVRLASRLGERFAVEQITLLREVLEEIFPSHE